MSSQPAKDFDFLYGRWHVRNRKLRDNTDPNCDEWVEFDATSEAYPVLDGVGHLDRMEVREAPDGPPFQAVTLRLLRRRRCRWSRDPAAFRLVRRPGRTQVGATILVRRRCLLDPQLGDESVPDRYQLEHVQSQGLWLTEPARVLGVVGEVVTGKRVDENRKVATVDHQPLDGGAE